ncbi:uncharacterized protein Bfra_006321 [Botrytis fragariae]|uniref:Uncharacterized protein n=1 Tax=Botrytis fragariae TaxID=1964551 RepID=A0A8H6B465_9HELO|nr:uncharacterized protein Bfra_006321 [Botrytis fragariae]KAF5879116.1 hypothetical protein Bfra_006321 [Botrytis fragariae]
MVFSKEDSKGFQNSRKPTKIPRSVATSAHPHIKMNPSTPTFTSPMKSESNCAARRTPETPTRARKISRCNSKDKGMSRKTSFSKIPSSPGSTRMLQTSPIAFALAGAGRMNLRYRDTPSISSTGSDSTIREKIAEAMATDQFAMSDRDIPLSPQNKIRIIAANMSNPLANKGKSLPTTGITLPESTDMKGVISQVESPPIFSEAMASPAVPKPVLTCNASYTSSTYTPAKIFIAPSTPSTTRKPAGSSLSRPIKKKSQSTPLLPKRHRSSTGSSRHVVASSAPSEFYEYHTINGTIDLPFPFKQYSSGDSSGYHSGVSGSGSTSSSRTSLKNIYRGFLHNVRPRVLGAYVLFGGSIIWLVWMTSSKILTGKKGNPGRGHGRIGGHVSPYGMSIPTLTPSFPTHSIEELMPVDEPYLSTGGANNRQITQNSHKSRPNTPSKSEPEESLWDILSFLSVPLAWMFGLILVLLFILGLLEYLPPVFPSGGGVADRGWSEKV